MSDRKTRGLAPPAPIGARVTPAGVDYRVWAPDQPAMHVRVESGVEFRRLRMRREDPGYWRAFDTNGRAGDLYRFEFSDGRLLPDAASRFQPLGVHGPSECVDPGAYRWRSNSWARPGWTGQTIYEVHVGTLTAEGTHLAVADRLDRLMELGIEAIEIMPVADFQGDRNWGYDGVALYAPARCYGRPDDLRTLVDAAHGLGLAVILDVVYNHLGPAGNYLGEYSADYFHMDRDTPWGRPFNLDGPRSRPVRDFLVGNAAYWLDEFRFDGLRLDATHAIPDGSPLHLLQEIAGAAHARGGFVIAEDERNEVKIVRKPNDDGFGVDAVWADDFHHQVRVALTGAQEGYLGAYRGTASDVASTLAHGWTYRGQPYGPWGGRPRGSACEHLPAKAFIFCIENHDQVGNRAKGERLEHLVTLRQFRAASMLLCLGPYPPMIFMGQEWAASAPFLYFTNHGGDLGRQVTEGRRREFENRGQGWSPADLPDPEAQETFERSRLSWEERTGETHAATLALYRECLRHRRQWLRGPTNDREHWHVLALGEFIGVRYEMNGLARLLLVALRAGPLPTGPLPQSLRPPRGCVWRAAIRSEETRFGGTDEPPAQEDWRIAGPGAVWLEATGAEGRHAAS